MKLLTVAVPCYNSQDYMSHAVDSLLAGGDEVEIIIVDDGSTDNTADIADVYAETYPDIVRVVHQENGGHGDAVMAGLRAASGLYFKVVDSDDWLDAEEYPKLIRAIRELLAEGKQVDAILTNYIYDKTGARHKRVIHYRHALPQGRPFDWEDTRHFRTGQYIQMHSLTYRTELLRDCGLILPKHTFYVDELYAYVPLVNVKQMLYLDLDLYHYYIGRVDQSVQEDTMIRRIDQVLAVNKQMVRDVKLDEVSDPHLKRYLMRYLEIITTIASVLLIKSGIPENREKKETLWRYIKQEQPAAYPHIRRGMMGRVVHLKGRFGRHCVICAYKISQRIYGFN